MDIEKIELVTEDAGIAVAPQFRITEVSGLSHMVPADPSNRHFFEVRDWYEAQENKPFEFDFDQEL